MSQNIVHDLGVETLRATPPAVLYALTLNEWLAVFGIAFIILQAAYLLWKWRREWTAKKAASVSPPTRKPQDE